MSTDLIQLINRYALAREERLALQRQVDNLAKNEAIFKSNLIDKLNEQGLAAAASARFMVKYTMTDKPIAGNWEEIYQYIKENDAYDLLQRRLGEAAVRARWEDGITIPGVQTFPVDKLTVSKV